MSVSNYSSASEHPVVLLVRDSQRFLQGLQLPVEDFDLGLEVGLHSLVLSFTVIH